MERQNKGEEGRGRQHLVEADGSILSGDQDAPGQSFVYIPPGDHFIESYRLATFSEFPKNVPVKPTELAMIGFYYTGFKDRVKCFSCGMCVENFMLGDSVFDQRWHSSDCKMISGQETMNVPTHMSHLRILFRQFTGKQTMNLQLSANNFSSPSTSCVPMEATDVTADLTRVQIQEQLPKLIFGNIVDPQHERLLKSLNLQKEVHRRKTFSKWPSYPFPYFPGELVKDGFFYLGNLDRVQCFSCSGVLQNWAPGDVVREQHIRHFRQYRMATETDPRNEPMTSNQRDNADEEDRSRMALLFSNENSQEPPDRSPAEQRHLAQYYPCNHAINPHMRALQRRLETPATLEQMAAAGLFYLAPSVLGVPMDDTDVNADLPRVRIQERLPEFIFGNVLDSQHERFLKSLNLQNEAHRRKTFAKWPSYPTPNLVGELAKEGFFYLGDLDRTQCFSCPTVIRNWAPHDSVREQHKRHCPDCRIVRSLNDRNIPMTDTERETADTEHSVAVQQLYSNHEEPLNPTAEEQGGLGQRYPCQNPVYLHMASLQRRVETFDHRWQNTRIRASDEQFARAGFFFLGERDKTTCFYCSGGLQNWNSNDEPWTEHAKWFPGCEFVLRQKGAEFVRRLVAADPNLNRPYISNAASYNLALPGRMQRNIPPQFIEAGILGDPNGEFIQAGGFANVPASQRRAVPRECLACDVENGRCFLRDDAQFANRDFTTAVNTVAEQESNTADSHETREEPGDGEEQPQEGEIENSCQSGPYANLWWSKFGKPPRGC